MYFLKRKRTKRLNWKKKATLKRGVSFILAFLVFVFGMDFNGFGVHIHVGVVDKVYAAEGMYGIWCSTCSKRVDTFIGITENTSNYYKSETKWYVSCGECGKILLTITRNRSEDLGSDVTRFYRVQIADTTVTFPEIYAFSGTAGSGSEEEECYNVTSTNSVLKTISNGDTTDEAYSIYRTAQDLIIGLYNYLPASKEGTRFTWTEWYDYGKVVTNYESGAVVTYNGLKPYLETFGYTVDRTGKYMNITTQPVNKTIKETENSSFTIAVDSNETYTCQWQVSTNGGSSWSNISNNSVYSGATTSTLSITQAPSGYDGYQYKCVVTGDTLSAISSVATLTVKYLNITSQPSDRTIKAAEDTTMSVSINANETYICQWQVSTNGGSSWSNISNNSVYSGAATNALQISQTPFSYNGYKYRCIVKGESITATSEVASLTVKYVSITTQPANKTVKELDSTSFTVAVNANESNTTQWQVSTNGGSSWSNISNNSVYSGAATNTLQISQVPFSYNGYKYRCVVKGESITSTSDVATLTVTSGLVFDSHPVNVSGFEKVNLTLTAPSSFAENYGSFQWQVKNSSGVWENLSDGSKNTNGANISYAGTKTDTLLATGYLTGTGTEQNITEYRCVISTNLDSLHGQMYSNSAKITIIRNGYKSIMASYTGVIDVPGSLDIDDVSVSVLYDNGNMVQANGWDNLFFTKDGTKTTTYNVTELGEQTVNVVLVDTQDSSRNLTTSFTITGADLTAPEWIEGACTVTDYDIVASVDDIKPISVTLAAEDTCSQPEALRYAFVKYGTRLSDGDFSSQKTYNVTLSENTKYIAYVKDEAGNMNEKEFYFNVLDDKAPIILSFTEEPDDEIVKSALLVANAKDASNADGVEGVGDLSYMFYSANKNTNLDNELLDTWISGNTVSINQTGIYYVKVKDALGNIIESSALVVDNLDAQAPEIEVSFSHQEQKGVIIVEATDKETTTAVASGLKVAQDGALDCFSVVDTESVPVRFEVSGNNQKAIATIPIVNNESNYVIRIVDNVGNVMIKEAIVKDTLAPVWIEEECSVSEFDIVANADEIKPISVTLSAEDLCSENEAAYTEKSALMYAFIPYETTVSDSDFSTKQTYTISLRENAKYVAYVKDLAGNVNRKEFYFNVLDNEGPVILSFTEDPDDKIVKSALLVANAKDASNTDGMEGVGELSYMFYSTDENINLNNELLDKWITGNTVSINQTGTYYVKVKDALDNVIESSALVVDNLDAQAPEMVVSFTRNDKGGVIVVEATDKETLTAVASGLKTAENGSLDCFSVVNAENVPVKFEVSGNSQKAKATIPIVNDNSNYIIRITDAAGNVALNETVVKDTQAPELTVRMELSEDGGSGIFRMIATDKDSEDLDASGLKTAEDGSLDCFIVTDADGNPVEVVKQVITENNGLIYSASAAFKTRTTAPYTLQAVDNAGNITTITQSMSTDIVDMISDGVITGIDGTNQLGTSLYPDWTQGTVQLTAYVQNATENYEWSLNYNEAAAVSEKQGSTIWHLGAYGPYTGSSSNGSVASYFSFPVSENGTYTVYAKDSGGGIYKRTTVVDNIDKIAPTFTVTVEGAMLIIKAEDDCSGVDHITIDGGSLATIQQKQCYGAKTTEIYANVSENGNYFITVYDVAGNAAASKNTTVTEADETKYYNVVFENEDGSVVKAQLVEEGKDATPPTINRTGYIFMGWDKSYSNIQEDRNIRAVFVKDGSDEDITAIGDKVYYRVDFLNHDGAIIDSQKVEEGGTAKPPTVSRKGYTFTGWDKSYSNVQEDRSIKALFIANEEEEEIIYYRVDFLNYDGAVIESQKVEKGGTANPPTVSRDGYTFTGWDKSYSNIQEDRSIKALFIANEEEEEIIYYRVDFLNYDGAVIESQKVEKGGTANPPSISRDGYTFTGWDKSYSNVQEDRSITALFVEGEPNANGGTSTGAGGSYSEAGTPVENSEVGKEFEEEETEAEEEVLTEEEAGNIVILSEFTDTAMLLGEYQEPEIKEDSWFLFKEEEVPLDTQTEAMITDTGEETGGSKAPAIIFLGGCGAAVAFYFLNKKYYWINLPF